MYNNIIIYIKKNKIIYQRRIAVFFALIFYLKMHNIFKKIWMKLARNMRFNLNYQAICNFFKNKFIKFLKWANPFCKKYIHYPAKIRIFYLPWLNKIASLIENNRDLQDEMMFYIIFSFFFLFVMYYVFTRFYKIKKKARANYFKLKWRIMHYLKIAKNYIYKLFLEIKGIAKANKQRSIITAIILIIFAIFYLPLFKWFKYFAILELYADTPLSIYFKNITYFIKLIFIALWEIFTLITFFYFTPAEEGLPKIKAFLNNKDYDVIFFFNFHLFFILFLILFFMWNTIIKKHNKKKKYNKNKK